MAGLSTHASYSQSVMYLPTPSTGKTRTPVELEISLKESRKNKITDRAMLPVTIDRNFHGGNRTPIVSPIKGIPSTTVSASASWAKGIRSRKWSSEGPKQ